MRNLRKLTAVVIAIALVLTSMTAAFAASTYSYEAEATVLQDLAILAGGTNGDLMLGKELTRAEGAVLVLKTVLGKTEADQAAADTAALSTFKDADKVPAWAEGWVALAVAAKVVNGTTDGYLNANEPLKGKDLASMFMNALGFAAENDYGTSVDLLAAKSKGTILADIAADITNVGLTRDVASALVFDALTVTAKDATKTLIETYIGSDAAKLAVAQEAGLVPAVATSTVTATGAKVLTAKFSTAVDTAKAAFAVKKGTLAVNVSKVEWNTAKTEATITLVSKLTKGDYVVTISGLDIKDPITVTAEDEKVASIEITSDIAPLVSGTTGNVTFPYVVKNQYGEDVTSTYGSSLIWTPSTGSFGADPSTGKKLLIGSFTKDATFTVTAIYAAANVSTTKLIKVGEVAKVAKINVLGIYNADGKTLFTDSTFTDFYAKVEAFDQYGTSATLAQLNDATQVTVVSSNGTVVTKSALGFVKIGDTDYIGLQLDKPASNVSGTATINFIANSNGTSAQQTVVVEKPATLTKLNLEVPADMVAIGESIKIPFTAQDQNGVELSETQKGAIDESVIKSSYTGLKYDFAYNYQTKKAELTLTVEATATAGSKLIMAATDAGNVSQITIDVKDAATPVAVSGVKNFAKLLTVGATSTINDDDISVIDQYGRTMTLDSTWFQTYKLDISSGISAKVSTSAISIIAVDGSVDLGGVATGTSTVSIKVVTKATDIAIANSNYEFTAETVAKSVITDYVIETPEVLYVDTAHKKAVTVYGKTSSGAKVALAAADYVISTNDTGVDYVAGYLDASDSSATMTTANSEKTATVIAVFNGATGPQTVTKTVTVTNKPAVVKTVSVEDATNITASGDILYVKVAGVSAAGLKAAVTAKDQYDVAISPSVTNLLITNLDGVTVVDNGTSTPTINDVAAGDAFTVTFITQSGINKTVSVVVVP